MEDNISLSNLPSCHAYNQNILEYQAVSLLSVYMAGMTDYHGVKALRRMLFQNISKFDFSMLYFIVVILLRHYRYSSKSALSRWHCKGVLLAILGDSENHSKRFLIILINHIYALFLQLQTVRLHYYPLKNRCRLMHH